MRPLGVRVHWLEDHEGKDSSGFSRVLYSYSDPTTHKLLYLGKADYCTVQERHRGAHKEKRFAEIREFEGLDRVLVRVGVLYLEQGRKFSSELLSDVESLLIYHVQPQYNKQAKRSRIARLGLVVTCTGDWRHPCKQFADEQ